MLDDLTPRKAIEFAVMTEENGAVFYRKMAKRLADDGEIAEVFEQLARDEEAHKRAFQELLETVPEEFAYKSQKERLAVLRATSMGEFFLGDAGLFKHLDRIKTRTDALHRALLLEKDTLSYYQAMRDVMGPNEIVEAMIQAERLHVAQLMYRLAE
jgi:rubrerythrin